MTKSIEDQAFQMFDEREGGAGMRWIARDLELSVSTVRRQLTVFDELKRGNHASGISVNGWTSSKVREVAELYEKWVLVRNQLGSVLQFQKGLDPHRAKIFELASRLSFELEAPGTTALSGIYSTVWPVPWKGRLPNSPVHLLESYDRFPFLRTHLGSNFIGSFEGLKRSLGNQAKVTELFRLRTGNALGIEKDRLFTRSEKTVLSEMAFGSLYRHVKHINAGSAGLTAEPAVKRDEQGCLILSLGPWSTPVAELATGERIAKRLSSALRSARDWPESSEMLAAEERVSSHTKSVQVGVLMPESLGARLKNSRCIACPDDRP
ncbi:MAG: hypothetical protein IIB27_05210 [Chloroflexi bacterium]|nr:hypothetical protein [Chloroflexota bacterium]